MEFGKTAHIEDIDFSLPPDDPMNEELWRRLALAPASQQLAPPPHAPQLYVGCTQWGRADWVGKVYPKGTKPKDFLSQYVKQFNCIELNTLFYSLQPKPVIERWAALAGEGFRFCPKMSESISHKQQLRNAGQETALFIDHLTAFGDRLGTSFLQLSESFSPDLLPVLCAYLRALPRDFQLCLELRHKDWFLRKDFNELYALLVEKEIGTVITDTAGRRDVLHMRLTAPVVFIRWVANNGHPKDFPRIEDWAYRLKTWMEKGMREIYFIVHSPDEFYAPDLALRAVEKFNEVCGTHLKPPKLLSPEPPPLTLF
ncbi:MAG: DUF72 domain-containing protein [Bacteroidetes bacterium]|nr:DUF72 domain-containing protein [Bacteroidota bacterium]